MSLVTKLLKECRNEIAPVITYLINLSFETGCYPESLKLSIVKPLHKKGDRSEINNYRPITLIPVKNVIDNLDLKNFVTVLFFDMSKAWKLCGS